MTARVKRVAIMQPYLFPYLGYFNLIHAADEFILLDSVQFIAGGWGNRNRVLVKGAPHLFTLPVRKGARSERFDAQVMAAEAPRALERLRRTVEQTYAKAPRAEVPVGILRDLADFLGARPECPLVDLNAEALRLCMAASGLSVPLRRASALVAEGTGQERVINLCHAVGAGAYVNMIGGQALYDRAAFESAGLALQFLTPRLLPYAQTRGAGFVPGLSILDLLAHLDAEALALQLSAYALT